MRTSTKTLLILCFALLAGLSACRGRSPLPPDTACPTIYQPVCGRDGKTYQNACEARKAGQVTTASGECGSTGL